MGDPRGASRKAALRTIAPTDGATGDPASHGLGPRALPAGCSTRFAVFGYLLPAGALLVGAGFGAAVTGSEPGTALGAAIGFVSALVVARVATSLLPGAIPIPELISISHSTPIFFQESHHEH